MSWSGSVRTYITEEEVAVLRDRKPGALLTRKAEAMKEPSFGKQCKGESSCSNMPSKNPGESVEERRPPSSGASYDRAGGPSGQPTEQVPESQYKTEGSDK